MTDDGAHPDGGDGSRGSAGFGGIRGIVSDNIPAIAPQQRAFVVVSGVLAMVLLAVALVATDLTVAKWIVAGTIIVVALNSLLQFRLSQGTQRSRRLRAAKGRGRVGQRQVVAGHPRAQRRRRTDR
jgi:hypothetical protein